MRIDCITSTKWILKNGTRDRHEVPWWGIMLTKAVGLSKV